jgi:tetratricopeptide (TPR) repeat protein
MPERRVLFYLYAVFGATVLALYAHVFHCDFIDLDDKSHVTQNPCVMAGLRVSSVNWAFSHFIATQYIPLSLVSHMADISLFGLDPRWHHLGNVLLHALNACLVLTALRALTGRLWPSAIVAALFAVHPINVESVAWIAERKNVLSTTFWLLAMCAYARHARQPAGRWMWLVALCMALGLLAKPMLVTLPCALLLLDVWPLRRHETPGWWHLVREKAPLWLLTVAACASTLAAAAHDKALVAAATFTWGERFANALLGYLGNLRHLFWPRHLAVLYPLPASYPLAQVFGAALVLAGVTAGCLALRKRAPAVLIGWLWFLGILVPVSSVFQVGAQAYADRFTYIPQLGIFWALVWTACALPASWRGWLRPLAAVAVVALAAGTVRQLSHWTDTATLFEYTLSVTPKNGIAHTLAGVGHARRGADAQAVAHFREAQRFLPANAEVCSRLGEVLARTGEKDEAVRQLRAAVALEPRDGVARFNLVALLVSEGRAAEAAQYLPR